MIAAAAALVLMLAPGAAGAPRPGLLASSETNLRYALAQVCLPFVEHGDASGLQAKWGVSAVGWGPQTLFKSVGVQARLIGAAGKVNVGVGTTPSGSRQCLIETNEGRPSAHREVLLREAAAHGLVAARTPYTPNGFAFRDTLCAPTPSAVAILISTEPDAPARFSNVKVSVLSGGPRSWRCDADGPPTNYPTPASPPPPR